MSNQIKNLLNKKGLILGVANEHSIAYGCAHEAINRGANVIATCLNQKAHDAVEPLAKEMQLQLAVCNVENESELASLVDLVAKEFGQLDFIIHSIAWAPLQELHGRVIDTTSEGFSRAMNISCHSFARTAKLFAPLMKSGGSMVTMSYLGADEVVEHYGLMGPVKAALESLVRYMAVELGPQNIRVHALSPGPIPTRAASGIEAFDDLIKKSSDKAPLKRLPNLKEISTATLFLCSDDASGMTGQTIYVDGGCHAVA